MRSLMKSRSLNTKSILQKLKMVSLVLLLSFLAAKTPLAHSAENDSSVAGSRNFYQVLDEVLSDFEYDLKAGQVVGLKDLAIRNVMTSENVPPSFKSHLELLVTERILKTTKATDNLSLMNGLNQPKKCCKHFP